MSVNRQMVQRAALILVVGIAIGLIAGRTRWRREGRLHIPARSVVIEAQARQIASGQLMVVGDSLIERTRLGRLCGLDTLNAGISDARAKDMTAIGRAAEVIAKPSIVVIALGTNDLADDTPITTFVAEYGELIDTLHPKIIVGIGDRGDPRLRTRQDAFNRYFATEAARRGIVYIPPLSAGLLGSDHLHLTVAGAQAWQSAIEAHCPQIGER